MSKPASVNKEWIEIEAKEIANAVSKTHDFIVDLSINNEVDYSKAGETLRAIQTKKISLEQKQKKITDPLSLALRETRKLFKPWIALCVDTRKLIENKREDYRFAQEATIRIEEEKLKKQAEKEQKKLDQAAAKKARLALKKGDKEKAHEIMSSVPMITSPVLARSETPKEEGIKLRKIYSFKIVDAKLLPREFLMPNEKAIGALIRATKGSVEIPGVEITSRSSEAVEAEHVPGESYDLDTPSLGRPYRTDQGASGK